MDLGIYVHVPFCRVRCPYCAFVLVESGAPDHPEFVEAVRREILASPHDGRAATVFFGGGTPSVLTAREVGAILGAIRGRFGVAADAEITLEANPDGLAAGRLADLRGLGVDRLSLGAQSFDDGVLTFLGRTHRGADVPAAVDAARTAGFDNVVLDLIAGTPGQTVEGWRGQLRRAVDLGVEHVSVYGLTVERGTPLERDVKARRAVLPDEATQRAMYDATMEVLEAAGYEAYELSNYAKPGRRSRHNLAYWTGAPYLGFGPGAHSFVPPRRWANAANVARYVRGERGPAFEETLSPVQRSIERIFLGLRVAEGFDAADLLAAPPWEREVESLEGMGLVERSGGRLRLTRRGRPVADEVVGRLASAL